MGVAAPGYVAANTLHGNDPLGEADTGQGLNFEIGETGPLG